MGTTALASGGATRSAVTASWYASCNAITPCAGSLIPMRGELCFPDGEFKLGGSDVHLGDLRVAGVDEPVSFWMSESQFEYWRHTHLTVDVAPGRGSGFSVEAPEGVRFLIRSRLLTDEEVAELDGV